MALVLGGLFARDSNVTMVDFENHGITTADSLWTLTKRLFNLPGHQEINNRAESEADDVLKPYHITLTLMAYPEIKY